MYCTNCGKQLPDDARFCDSCGAMVTPKQPQYHTAPYTVPLDADPEVKAQARQYPNYTVPLDSNAQQYPQHTVPVDDNQQYSQYTAPADGAQQYPQYTAPVDTPPQYQPQQTQHTTPVDPMPQYTPPVQPQYTAPTGSTPKATEKKRVRKLPILLTAIAAVVVILIIAGLSGGDKETETTTPKPSSTVENNSVPATQPPKVDPPEVHKFPEGQPRYDETGFTFTVKQFTALYDAALEKFDCPFHVFDEYKEEDNKHSFNLWHTGRQSTGGVYLFLTEDPDTGLVTEITMSMYPDETDARYNKDLNDAVVAMVYTAHGNMQDEYYDWIAEATELGTSANMGGLQYRVYDFTSFTNFTVNPVSAPMGSAVESTEPASSGTDTEAINKFPEGKARFNHNSFLFNNEEFAQLYAYSLQENGVDITLGTPSVLDGVKFNYPVQYQGEKIGFLIVETSKSTGNVIKASINIDLQGDDTVDDHSISATLCLIETGHGAMTSELWSSIADAEPTAVRDNYTIYIHRLNGMEASMTIYADRVFVSICIGD